MLQKSWQSSAKARQCKEWDGMSSHSQTVATIHEYARHSPPVHQGRENGEMAPEMFARNATILCCHWAQLVHLICLHLPAADASSSAESSICL